jgi:hypothetical protein
MSLGQMNVYTLTLQLPLASSSNYEVEVYMPFNNSQAALQLCSVMISYAGVNNPCPALELFPVYNNRMNISGGANDYATWNLGKITNSGWQSTAVDPLANTIIISIITQVAVNSTINVVGYTPWVTTGVTYSPGKLWVAQQAVIISSTDISPAVCCTILLSVTCQI